jgi:uncharacterized protein (TIGR03083 family)
VNHTESFGIAAESFLELVGRIPAYQWNDPGLGTWSVRDLVGHTSRAITTIETYLAEAPADTLTLPNAEAYYSEVFARFTNDEAVAARGVEAGERLGENPMRTITADVVRASAAAAAQPVDRLVSVGGMGIPLAEYLRTRVFELVVHSLDIAKATDLDHHIPVSVIADVAALSARVAALKGDGEYVLFALTGRGSLAQGYSILG